jgi:hypothetical protein
MPLIFNRPNQPFRCALGHFPRGLSLDEDARCSLVRASRTAIGPIIGRPTTSHVYSGRSYTSTGRSNRDDDKTVLNELVPTLPCLNSSGAGASLFDRQT